MATDNIAGTGNGMFEKRPSRYADNGIDTTPSAAMILNATP